MNNGLIWVQNVLIIFVSGNKLLCPENPVGFCTVDSLSFYLILQQIYVVFAYVEADTVDSQ